MSPAELGARYRAEVAALLPRILGLGDRRPDSPTYGCFDRGFWHYRLLDFPNGQQQQASLLLACAADLGLADPAALRRWARAAAAFWARSQHADGSHDEAYPYERGYCVTAMAYAANALAARRLGSPEPAVCEALRRGARWLTAAPPPPVANQVAAAGAGLLAAGAALDDDAIRRAGREVLAGLVAAQDPDGFFLEYGGQDTGYQSLTLSFLARSLADMPELAEPLRRGRLAAAARLDAWGRHDPAANARRTQFVYPFAFAAAADAEVLTAHVAGLDAGAALSPAWLDDRYVIWLSTDYLLAAEALCPAAPTPRTLREAETSRRPGWTLSPTKLVGLRLAGLSTALSPRASRLLRRGLVWWTVQRRPTQAYAASSTFFDGFEPPPANDA